jgi:hypothetical protein
MVMAETMPPLRPRFFWSGITGMLKKPDPEDLSRPNGSATFPDRVNQLQVACSAISELMSARLCSVENRLRLAIWIGCRQGLFSYNINQDGGTACFAWFHYQHKGPLGGL